MEKKIDIKQIGEISTTETGFAVRLQEKYKGGLTGIKGFNFLEILWWADRVDRTELREITVTDKPYVKGPEKMGIFATRSPVRPNPLGLTIIEVTGIDLNRGIIYTSYIDAEPGTPVIDIKPYYPCTSYPEGAETPEWCRHWPESIQASGKFDWEKEFNF